MKPPPADWLHRPLQLCPPIDSWFCLASLPTPFLHVSSEENTPLEEVFENLRCSREGLSTQQAQQRLKILGPNKLEKEESKFLKFLGFMWNPLSWVMEAAAIMAIAALLLPTEGGSHRVGRTLLAS